MLIALSILMMDVQLFHEPFSGTRDNVPHIHNNINQSQMNGRQSYSPYNYTCKYKL